MAQPPGDPMSGDRAAHGAAHHEPGACGSVGVRRVRGGEVYDEARTSRAETTSHGGGELVPMSEPRAGRQHRRGPAQAESRSRPLRRRPATMARPARVRIRSRKPCVRARRRLFGWKVRLPLLTSRLSRSTARCGAGRRSALGLDGYALLPRRHASRHTGHRAETTCEPPAYAAAREAVKPPSPPVGCGRRTLVAVPGVHEHAPPHNCGSGGIVQTSNGSSSEPARSHREARAYRLAHRCGQVWGWIALRRRSCGRRHVRPP